MTSPTCPQTGRFPFANDELDGVTSYSFVLSAAGFADGSYYTVKIDEWPNEAENDLDNSIDEILAFLLAEDDNVTEESVLPGAIIKGGTQTTECYTYGPGSTGPDVANELLEGTGLTLGGTSANASPSNATNTTFDYDEIFE